MKKEYKAKEKNIKIREKQISTFFVIVAGCITLAVISIFSVTKGVSSIPVKSVVDAFMNFDSENKYHLILRDLRVPRLAASMLVGSALSVAGAIMQGTTRNPMADSGLMGINAGAGFSLSLSFAFMPQITYLQTIIFCFAGAALTSFLVNKISSSRSARDAYMNKILAGAAVGALFTSLSQGIAIMFEVSQDIMFWTVGCVSAAGWNQVIIMAPVIIASLIAACINAEKVTCLSLGEDVAVGLGLNIKLYQIAFSALVVLLAGISVSVVGAVGFVGLVIPHIARFIVGVDYRNIIPVSAVLGANLMVLADLAARTINPPAEAPVGALISMIGVPFFLYLERKRRRAA